METQQIRRAGKLVPASDDNNMEIKRVVDRRRGLCPRRVLCKADLVSIPAAAGGGANDLLPRGCLCQHPFFIRLRRGWTCNYSYCKVVKRVM